jgi:hypothetical protein
MNAFNRTLFILIGIALVGAGALGVASGLGLLDGNLVDDVHDEIFAVDWADRGVQIGAAVAGIVAVFVSLLLLIREILPPRRADPMIEVSRGERGRTRVNKSVLRRTFEHAASEAEGVARARVESLKVSKDGVKVGLEARVNGGYPVGAVSQEVLARGAEAVTQTFPDRPGQVDAVIELAHGRRARKRTRRVR